MLAVGICGSSRHIAWVRCGVLEKVGEEEEEEEEGI